MTGTVRLGDRQVGPGAAVLVIAEAGVNHNGSVDRAFDLVDAAATAGADAVKFQTFRAELLATADAPKAGYQERTTGRMGSQREMLRDLELPADAFRSLRDRASEQGLLFMSSPFDEESLALLDQLDVPAIKIASGELTDHFLLEASAATHRPLIISTGMATLEEVAEALAVVARAGPCEVILLHCVSEYPTEPTSLGLRAIETLRATFRVPVGFSDHTTGLEAAYAAVALGACVIEKHITLDRSLSGPDHAASLDPVGFAALVRGIRTVESSLGDGSKMPTAGELRMRDAARRSIALRQDVASGTRIEAGMLMALRPGTGIPANERGGVIGRRARHDLKGLTLLEWSDLE